MRVRILGCSGGIGGQELRTTSLLADHDILIDAGTGVGILDLEELALIDHVFLTHSHLDHIACLPFIPDTVGDLRSKPLTIYSTQKTQDILKAHIFNWLIWPDFTEIPNRDNPFMRFQVLELGESVTIDGRTITALPASHTVPAVGYQVDSGKASLVFTGDTTTNDELWEVVNKIPNLGHLIIETAFTNSEEALAKLSKHLSPDLLIAELDKLQGQPLVYITHLKPGKDTVIADEIGIGKSRHRPSLLRHDQIIEF